MGKGSVHCYGHVHDSYNHYGRSYNVGVDVNGFKPVLLDDIIDICSAKPLDLIDHHSPETTY
jgi:calcineurin-like phosphoesterase family protein